MKKFHIIVAVIFLATAILTLPTPSYSGPERMASKANVVSVRGEDGVISRIAGLFSNLVDKLAELAGEIRLYLAGEKNIPKIAKQRVPEAMTPEQVLPVPPELSEKAIEDHPAGAVVKTETVLLPERVREDRQVGSPGRAAAPEQTPEAAGASAATLPPSAYVAPPTPAPAAKNPVNFSFVPRVEQTADSPPMTEQSVTEQNQTEQPISAPVRAAETAAQPVREPKIATLEETTLPQAAPPPLATREDTMSAAAVVISAPVISAIPARIIPFAAPVTTTRMTTTTSRTAVTTTVATTRESVPVPTVGGITTRTAATPIIREFADSMMMTAGVATRAVEPVSIPALRVAAEPVCQEEFESDVEGEIANLKITDDRKFAVVLTIDGRIRRAYAFSICSGESLECPATAARGELSPLEEVCAAHKDAIVVGDGGKMVDFISRFDDHLAFVYKNVFYVTKGTLAIVADLTPSNLTEEGRVRIAAEVLKVEPTGAGVCENCSVLFTVKDEAGADVSSLLNRTTVADPILSPPIRYSRIQTATESARDAPKLTVGVTVTEPTAEKTVKVEKTLAVVFQ